MKGNPTAREKGEEACAHPSLPERASLRTGFFIAVHNRRTPSHALGKIVDPGQLAANGNVSEIQKCFKSLLCQ